jgi:hypothetical protein
VTVDRPYAMHPVDCDGELPRGVWFVAFCNQFGQPVAMFVPSKQAAKDALEEAGIDFKENQS